MVDVERALNDLGELALMKYFPSGPEAMAALLKMVCEMADNNEQVRWLVNRALAIYNEWPGPREIRACFCSKFRPKDGINAYSKIYADGIPSEKAGNLAIGAPPLKQLPAGSTVSADATMDRAVGLLASVHTMPKGKPVDSRVSKALRDILTPPQDRPKIEPTPQVITQADIDRAVAELREKKARQEMEQTA